METKVSKLEALHIGTEAHLEGAVGEGPDLGVRGVLLFLHVPYAAVVEVHGGHKTSGAWHGWYRCVPLTPSNPK